MRHTRKMLLGCFLLAMISSSSVPYVGKSFDIVVEYTPILLPEVEDEVKIEVCSVPIPSEYEYLFRNWSYSISCDAVAAIASVESGWSATTINTRNRNGSSDIGLMQLNSNYIEYFVDKYWDSYEVFDPLDPEHSFFIAVRHLEWLLQKLESEEKAIKAYNVGYTAVRRESKPLFAQQYYERVAGVMSDR